MGERSRLAVWLFTAAAVVVIIAVAAAPAVVSWRLRAVVAQGLSGTPTISVRVRAQPWAVVTGALGGVAIDVHQAIVGRLPVDRLALRLRDVTVDPGRLLRGDPSALVAVGGGEGEVTLTQRDIETFLAAAKGVRRVVLRLQRGVVAVEGDVTVATLDFRVRMEGRLVVASPTTVDLYVQTLTVSGVEIPQEIGTVLVAGLNPLIALDGLPVPLRIETVAVEDGKVRMTVRVEESS